MNKPTRTGLLFLAGLLLAAACEKAVSDGPEPITISLRNSNAGPASDDIFVSVKYNGDWTLKLLDTLGHVPLWASLKDKYGEPLSSGRGEKNDIFLSFTRNSTGDDRYLEVQAVSDKGETVSAPFVQFYKEQQYREDYFPSGWMELSELKADSGLEFFTHPMKIGNLKTRNYSFCYDRKNLTSWWVAYPLNGKLISSGSRTDAWGFDPKIPKEYQQDLSGGYGPGYDRGHQCPSADRLSRIANIETFYYTNMTPQKSSFNQGMWASLENQVRNWARNADTLYVVTGCQVESPIGYVRDHSSKTVPVPSAYFKALLAYKRSLSTLKVQTPSGSWTSVAFWYDHSNPGSDYKKGRMTVNQLEEILGYDLFVNLSGKVSADVAEQIESLSDPWWN